MCEMIEGIDDMNRALISLNQYKTFDKVEYRLMVTTRFEAEFCKWMSLRSAVIRFPVWIFGEEWSVELQGWGGFSKLAFIADSKVRCKQKNKAVSHRVP